MYAYLLSVVCPTFPEHLEHGTTYVDRALLNDSYLDALGYFDITYVECNEGFYINGTNQTICNHKIKNDWLFPLPECQGKLIIKYQMRASNLYILAMNFNCIKMNTNYVISDCGCDEGGSASNTCANDGKCICIFKEDLMRPESLIEKRNCSIGM